MEILTVLKDISEINFSGNVIPHTWYKHVTYTTEGGKTKADLLAINILADIVYWHRLTVIRDESSGQIVEYKKKFKGNKLQKSYSSYADQFGSSKRSVKYSIDLLVELNLIQRDFEDIKDMGLFNVMYLTPNPEEIYKITEIEPVKIASINQNFEEVVLPKPSTPLTKISNTPYKEKKPPLPKLVGGITKISDTNTEITPEINKKIYLIVRGGLKDKNFQKAFNEFLVEDSIQYRDDTFFWINHNAEKYGCSLNEVTHALRVCTDKFKEGEISYLTGILRKKAEAKEGGVKGFGKRQVFAIYEYLKYRLQPHVEWVKNYDLDMENKILHFSIHSNDPEDKNVLKDIFTVVCENIKSEFGVQLQPVLR